MEKSSKIYIAGHNGMVGSSIKKLLIEKEYDNILVKNKSELNLLDQTAVSDFFLNERPEVVILAAAKVGGINANIQSPADFLYQNLQIQNNIIHSSHLSRVKKIIFLGSSCIYPKDCLQPMKEEYLLTGKLEETNEGYALAKISGLKMLEFYKKQYGLNSLSLMPCNLYGPNDSFNLEHSHVLSALVKRFSDAVIENSSEIKLWGTGIARREFMHVDDLARAVLHFSNSDIEVPFFNIGWGDDISIKELALLIANKVKFNGKIIWDDTKPNGMLRKCMDVTLMKSLGFSPNIDLSNGIDEMIKIYNQEINIL
ncbi:GDP-L-fucose synthase family protein [Aquirufa antheringensis]|uniref:GDP-L-fucose synthase family protein n=2 Tax=Pseudomonadati TaxID=3379134 RepID=UPI003BAEEAA7